MKNKVFRIAAASCFLFAASAPVAMAHDDMMHHGDFAGRMFDEMDANHDGVVTKQEFDAYHDKRFKELDANHDGKISREEMETARQNMKGNMREQLKKHFAEADANHDGALSKEEAQKMPFVAQHFEEIDANHDGKVTLDEIEAALPKIHGHGGMMSCDREHGGPDHCDGMDGGMMHRDGMMK